MSRVVVITGGSSGIGKACAKYFIQAGDTVFNLSRTESDVSNIINIKTDVSDEQSVISAVDQIISSHKKIDVLVNNAGYGISGSSEFTKLTDAKNLFNVNFFGALSMIQAVLPHMRNQKSGIIINLSSVAAEFAIPFQSFYSATKASINMLTYALKNELLGFNVNITSLMCGDAKTGFTKQRQKSFAGQEIYGDRIEKSVLAMEKDEQNGMPPEKIAKIIYSISNKTHPKVSYIAGNKYKVFVFIKRFVSTNLANKIVGMLYK